MNEHETITDIIAEMRALSNPISDGIIAIDGRIIADRLDAAHRRERNRNFHRFATAEEAAKAWNERRFKDLCVVCAGCTFDRGPEECAPGADCEIGWLYAEAQEGGAK